jgi:hypothetical protein
MSKGIGQTDGPQLLVRGALQWGTVQVGGQWKNVVTGGAHGEGQLFVTDSKEVASFQLGLGAALKVWTGAGRAIDHHALEISTSATRRFGPVSGRVSIVYSTNELGRPGRSLFVEAGPAFDLGHGWNASANVGRRQLTRSHNYTSFNGGIAKAVHKLTLDLRYFATNRDELGGIYRNRIVGSARLSF